MGYVILFDNYIADPTFGDQSNTPKFQFRFIKERSPQIGLMQKGWVLGSSLKTKKSAAIPNQDDRKPRITSSESAMEINCDTKEDSEEIGTREIVRGVLIRNVQRLGESPLVTLLLMAVMLLLAALVITGIFLVLVGCIFVEGKF